MDWLISGSVSHKAFSPPALFPIIKLCCQIFSKGPFTRKTAMLDVMMSLIILCIILQSCVPPGSFFSMKFTCIYVSQNTNLLQKIHIWKECTRFFSLWCDFVLFSERGFHNYTIVGILAIQRGREILINGVMFNKSAHRFYQLWELYTALYTTLTIVGHAEVCW